MKTDNKPPTGDDDGPGRGDRAASGGGQGRGSPRGRRVARPLDPALLDELALGYVARFATSRQRLLRYLNRKLAERGWDAPVPPDPAAVADRLAGIGYVDDAAFAAARARTLAGRGLGARRLQAQLRADGIGDDDAAVPLEAAARDEEALAAALRFARRRRIGPFAAAPLDPDQRRRAFAAMMRAGHPPALATRILASEAGHPDDLDDPDKWDGD